MLRGRRVSLRRGPSLTARLTLQDPRAFQDVHDHRDRLFARWTDQSGLVNISSQGGALFGGQALSIHGGRTSSANEGGRLRSTGRDSRSAFRRCRTSGRCQRRGCRDLIEAEAHPTRRGGRTIAGLQGGQYRELLTTQKDRARHPMVRDRDERRGRPPLIARPFLRHSRG